MALAPTVGSDELSRTLFTVKELLLVGFFASIGFRGLPTQENIEVGLLLLLLLPVEAVLYGAILWGLGLRNRTSVLTSLLLANFSEFALIVAAMGIEAGWLSENWLMSLVVAVVGSFVVTSILNPRNTSTFSQLAIKLPARPPHKLHPQDRPIDIGTDEVILLGMGRVGRACYDQLTHEHGMDVVGVEHDPNRVKKLVQLGYHVVEGDATDADFWQRVVRTGRVSIVILAMPAQHANIDALSELRSLGFSATVACTPVPARRWPTGPSRQLRGTTRLPPTTARADRLAGARPRPHFRRSVCGAAAATGPRSRSCRARPRTRWTSPTNRSIRCWTRVGVPKMSR